MFRVRRAFTAGDARLPAGTIVDVTGWRNAYQLVDRGWLVPIDVEQTLPPTVKKTPVKRVAKKAAPKETE
jgi:hypothetical protein